MIKKATSYAHHPRRECGHFFRVLYVGHSLLKKAILGTVTF